jgi:hypothetical protein
MDVGDAQAKAATIKDLNIKPIWSHTNSSKT